MQQPPAITPAAAKALDALTDIETPAPVAWTPQTWGWVALGLVVLALAAWAFWRWRRAREANHYRVEALVALDNLAPLLAEPDRRGAALSAIGEVWKPGCTGRFPTSGGRSPLGSVVACVPAPARTGRPGTGGVAFERPGI